MQTQRTLFFGKKPAKTSKKDGANPPVVGRRFTARSPEDIEIRFDNTTATQFGGYPLWDTFLKEVKLDARLASHIKMNRGPNAFTAPEISRFFIDANMLGAVRLMDVDRMRFDPMLTQALGLAILPSDETIGRYFKTFDEGHLGSLERMNVRINNLLWKKTRKQRCGQTRSGNIILDYDSSVMTVYGKQEGADRGYNFRKKDNPGFQPKFAFIGGLGVMVNQALYPQSSNLPTAFEPFHVDTLSKLPKTARVWAIRGDGALYSEERIKWLEKKYTYAITAKRTQHLYERMTSIPEDEWVEAHDARGRLCSVARIRYGPKTWEEERTYVISRRLKDLKGQKVLWDWERYKYFAYVTNYRAPLVTQFQFCVERCSLESFIKESKSGFHYAALPCKELDANRAYLGHVQMSYNLMIWFKLLKTPRTVNRWTVGTLRARIFCVCGNLKRETGRWVLSLPALWPWRTLYVQIAVASGLDTT